MDRQGFEKSSVTAGLPTPQHTTGISGTDPTLGSQQHRGSEANTGVTDTVTDTEPRGTGITGVYVPVLPVEMGDATGADRHTETHEGHHKGEKKPMGEKVKEKIPGTQAHKEHKAEKEFEKGRY